MRECKLCVNGKEANQTGSHIIPHFLIKTMVNENGSKGRDKEVSFQINSINASTYFGRSVSIGKIEETMGGTLSDEHIEEQSNHFTIDYMLCDECEKKLSVIENYYSSSSNKGKVSAKLATLFWFSILWRISESNFSGLKMKNKDEKKIRKLLNTTLSLEIKEVEEKCKSNKDLFNNMAYRLIKSENIDPDQGLLFVAHPKHFAPYSVIINEYVVFFYMRLSYVNNIRQKFFGFEKFYSQTPVVDIKSDNEELFNIGKQNFSDAMEEVATFKAKDFSNELVEFVKDSFFKITAQKAPESFTKLVMNEIIHGESTIGERYSPRRICQIIADKIRRF